jgi:hypothetical protein
MHLLIKTQRFIPTCIYGILLLLLVLVILRLRCRRGQAGFSVEEAASLRVRIAPAASSSLIESNVQEQFRTTTNFSLVAALAISQRH